MIWILFALLVGLAWALWFILNPVLGLWVPVVCTIVLGVTSIVLFFYRFMKQRRAAAALEKAIAEQGAQQARNARPERRAEINALQKQITDGISALKASKLGGKKRGAGALYSLPWYAIVGPPGAGKTTALKHSGLVFPYADSSIRGVGGTRNCDWWFTNEAILLDTAGRYATEHEDQNEWLAFLDMLLKYRTDKPLNGLIVAVAVPDILDSNEQQLEEMGKKLRARIDEVMTRLRMRLPVYFLVTKCDLIGGFSEYFGDMRKSDRQQAWGSTFRLNDDISDPGGLFAREFDGLVTQIHCRANKRLAQERNRAARERIYQFPIEFAGIKRNMQELLAQIFMVNAFQGTPIFRGFYFSSGTQEGRPMDRVLQRMGQAMGIQPVTQQQAQPQVESKSYFLHDVFMKVVFPDADVAARSASEIRRQRLVRIGVSAAACLVAGVLAFPAGCSFSENKTFINATKDDSATAATLLAKDGDPRWADTGTIEPKIEKLDPLLERLQELDTWSTDGPPVGMQFPFGLMYHADVVGRPARTVYVANMQEGFVKPVKFELEERLSKIKIGELKGKDYYKVRQWLKIYLLLTSEVEHLNDDRCAFSPFEGKDPLTCLDWAAAQYTALWAELLTKAGRAKANRYDLTKILRPHVAYYFDLIRPREKGKGLATPVDAQQKLVNRAREALQKVPVRDRYYGFFVESLIDEMYDPAGDPRSDGNRKYPPVSLKRIFVDRPNVLDWLQSFQKESGKGWKEVEGPYTDKGHYAVQFNLKNAPKLFENDGWVVPLTDEEKGDRFIGNMKTLEEDYETSYIQQWRDFLIDLQVQTPANLAEAVALYSDERMQKQEWAYLRILRALEDHTQWKKGKSALENEGLKKVLNRKLNRKVTSVTKGLRFDLDVGKIGERTSKVPGMFKSTVGVGVPQETSGGALPETRLATYMGTLRDVRSKMQDKLEDNKDAGVNTVNLDLRNAMTGVEGLLQPTDDLARTVLTPLFKNPLNVEGKIYRPTPRLTPTK